MVVVNNVHDQLYKFVTENPNLDELKATLKANATIFFVDEPMRQGWTLLMYACKSCHFEIVEYLITIGVNVNKQSDSITPLMAACQCNVDFQLPENEGRSNDVLKIVKLLLKNGAELNVTSQFGNSALMFAAENGHKKVIDLFIPIASLEAVDNNGCTVSYKDVETIF
jgi:ankyrin repeat protein